MVNVILHAVALVHENALLDKALIGEGEVTKDPETGDPFVSRTS
jgi:hypothetical protein